METAAGNRLSVAMRLPKHEVQIVNAYAKENGLTKTDAFLHFLRQGIASENERADSDRLRSIEQLLQEILRKVDAPAAAPSIADVRRCVAAEATKFPAIEKVILFGSIARGDAGPQSDVDLRLVLDRSEQFSLYDLAHLQKVLEKRLSREVAIITADTLKNQNLATAIEQEGITIYER
ncbi:nucleotidyltransferase family protein [Senegalimassilia anaerobia]